MALSLLGPVGASILLNPTNSLMVATARPLECSEPGLLMGFEPGFAMAAQINWGAEAGVGKVATVGA